MKIYKKTIVKRCPRSKSEVEKVCNRLKCGVDKDTCKYICVPNADLTALFEFCVSGNLPGLQLADHCPYLHSDDQLNAKNCTHFTTGCPNGHYRTEDIYQYPGCLNINKKMGCYVADQKCKSVDVDGELIHESNIMTKKLFPLIFPIFTAIYVVIALLIVGVVLYMYFCRRRKEGTIALPASGRTRKLGLNILLKEIREALTEEQIGCIREMHKGCLGKAMEKKDDEEFFDEMADRLNLEYNILYMQAILKRISKSYGDCDELVRKCQKFAESNSSTLYLVKESRPPVDGYTDVEVHIKGRSISREDVERVRTEIAQILEIDRNLVLYRGGKETNSFLLKFMVQNEDGPLKVSDTIDNSELYDIGVDFFKIGKKEVVCSKDPQKKCPFGLPGRAWHADYPISYHHLKEDEKKDV